ncbi:POK18 protein, partial [Syrrhaptes paradoxus]|nr:POK18 protein [Syrrhaptes paradoxus]
PWKYLGWKITEQTVEPQRIALRDKISTLNDLQKLLGAINCIRLLLGIHNETLQPYF